MIQYYANTTENPAVPYNIVQYLTFTMPCNKILHATLQYDTTQYHTIPYKTLQYHTIPYNAMQCHTIPYNTLQYHTIPYNTIQYHTTTYNIIQNHTILPLLSVKYSCIILHETNGPIMIPKTVLKSVL